MRQYKPSDTHVIISISHLMAHNLSGNLKTLIMTDSTDHSKSPSSPKTYPCPRCKKATAWHGNPYKPFCSDRCKLIDLGAWANEEYRVAAEESPFSDDLNH